MHVHAFCEHESMEQKRGTLCYEAEACSLFYGYTVKGTLGTYLTLVLCGLRVIARVCCEIACASQFVRMHATCSLVAGTRACAYARACVYVCECVCVCTRVCARVCVCALQAVPGVKA